MTEITQGAVAQNPPSFWEDAIDIFFNPVGVFRRRENDSFWKPFLFVAIAIGVIGFFTFESLQPLFEGEMQRQMAASNTKMTSEQAAQGMAVGMKIARFAAPIGIAFGMLILGVVVWLVSKIFSAKTTFAQAFMVVAWSYFPRILGTIASGVQGLFLDVSSMTSVQSVSLSPARFMDPTTANPVLFQMAGRFDITILWETVLLAIGIYVTGKISKAAATWFGVTIFLVGSLYAIRQGILLLK